MTVTRDATSHKFTPVSGAEWGQLVNGTGIGSLHNLWLMQEGSTPFADSVGTAPLGVGTPSLYDQPVSGWSRLAPLWTDGFAGAVINLTDTNLPDLHSASFTVMAYVAITATPAALRNSFNIGPGGGTESNNVVVGIDTSNHWFITDGTNTGTGTVNHGTGVVFATVRYNSTAGTVDLFVGAPGAVPEKISKTFVRPAASSFGIWVGQSYTTAPAMLVLEVGTLAGSTAEISDAQVTALYSRLNTGNVVSIAVTPSSPSVVIGSTVQLTATATMADGSTQDVTSNALTVWTSGTPANATVSATGLVTGVAVGASSITAAFGGATSPGDVITVVALVSIAVTPGPTTHATIGLTHPFIATGTYSDSSHADITSTVAWASSNTAIATVTTGLVTFISAGTVTITASLGGITGQSIILVGADENEHHPWPNTAQGIFDYGDSQVLWTGDRLMVARQGDYFLGSHAFWNRSSGGTNPLPWGIPAYLPQETDQPVPLSVGGEYIDSCLTPTLRCVTYTDSTGNLRAKMFDRTTGALVDSSTVATVAGVGTITRPQAINSNGTPVILFYASSNVYITSWNGAWTTAAPLLLAVDAYDTSASANGFYIVWRVGTAVRVGSVYGAIAAGLPFAWATPIPTFFPATNPDGMVAIATDPAQGLALAIADSANGTVWITYDVTLSVFSSDVLTNNALADVLQLCFRGLRNANGVYPFVAYWTEQTFLGLGFEYMKCADIDAVSLAGPATQKWQTDIVSRPFRVGDETFIWCRAKNAGTYYLMAGVFTPQICGYADREVALAAPVDGIGKALASVSPDPLDPTGTQFTWARLFNTGQPYVRAGNAHVGDLNFLPTMSTAAYGKSVYLAGAAVRCWDGGELGDAGFQNYPLVRTSNPGTGGGLTLLGTYQFRVYAVRYNQQGERFESAAVTYAAPVLTGSNNAITLSIYVLPDTNHTDVTFEVYRTANLGSTFYLDGTVANVATGGATGVVTYTSTRKDVSSPVVATDLIEQEADPHASGIGNAQEIESWGPVGCSILAVSGDRLWGAGGEVPNGFVQFSKLHDDGFGAGFDDLAGYQEVDTEGNAITSIVRINDTTCISEVGRWFVIASTGPDNFGNGAFNAPEIVLADGALNHVGTALTQAGAVYWGVRGPRLLSNSNYEAVDISLPIQALTQTLTPTGCRVDLANQEVVWYTAGNGDAVLWNYLGGNSRWARWTGLPVAGVSPTALAMASGAVFYPSDIAGGDNGSGFAFTIRSGMLQADQTIGGGAYVRAVGLTGNFVGPHSIRARIFYTGAPCWAEEWTWEPQANTYLSLVSDFGALTPAQVDALGVLDQTGKYMVHKRTARHHAAYFQVEISSLKAVNATFIPTEITLEIGVDTKLARIAPQTFGD